LNDEALSSSHAPDLPFWHENPWEWDLDHRALKILVVEDELLIGMDLVMLLEDWGYIASGPHPTPKAALAAIEEDGPDLAILDVNLGNGHTSIPIAEHLASLGIPFIFLTGYSSISDKKFEAFDVRPRLRKPVSENSLRRALSDLPEELHP